MLKVVRRVLGSKHPDIEDTLQEATIALLRALLTFRGECTAKHFACRVAALTALTTRRRDFARGGSRHSEPVDAADWADGAEDVDWFLAARRRQLLRHLLDELPQPQAEALILHSLVGLTMDELARTTHVRLETARSRLRLAKAGLRARIISNPAASDLLQEEDT
jgi:RNA polymerase sigma-70 factor (ECF subfamily)